MSCPVELRALELGRFARRVLRRPATVIARFERSVYVENRLGIACVGSRGIGSGPLNAIVTDSLRLPSLGEALCIEAAHARTWKPPPAPIPDASNLAQALARLDREGGRGLFPVRERHSAIHALVDWILAGARGRAPREAAMLIGMGAGLTPAGDDLVGGILVALNAVRRRAIAARVSSWALALAQRRTSRISRAHLACATAGEGGAALHGLVHALLSGKRNLAREIASIDAVGHTSGWDAAAGAAVLLESLSLPRRRRGRFPARAIPRARRAAARPA